MAKPKNKYLTAEVVKDKLKIIGKLSVLDALFIPDNQNNMKFIYDGKVIVSHETITYEFTLQNLGGKYFIAERENTEYQKFKNYILWLFVKSCRKTFFMLLCTIQAND